MARVAGVDLPREKRGEVALTYIYGIGRPTSIRVLAQAGVDADKRVKAWTDDEAARVRDIIERDLKVEGDLRGVAYQAKIVYDDTPSSGDSASGTTFLANLNLHHDQGARVHSNSWGNDGTTAYTGWCRTIDLHSRAREDSVVAFAVTNQSALKTPENAKSCLAVGASQETLRRTFGGVLLLVSLKMIFS